MPSSSTELDQCIPCRDTATLNTTFVPTTRIEIRGRNVRETRPSRSLGNAISVHRKKTRGRRRGEVFIGRKRWRRKGARNVRPWETNERIVRKFHAKRGVERRVEDSYSLAKTLLSLNSRRSVMRGGLTVRPSYRSLLESCMSRPSNEVSDTHPLSSTGYHFSFLSHYSIYSRIIVTRTVWYRLKIFARFSCFAGSPHS